MLLGIMSENYFWCDPGNLPVWVSAGVCEWHQGTQVRIFFEGDEFAVGIMSYFFWIGQAYLQNVALKTRFHTTGISTK